MAKFHTLSVSDIRKETVDTVSVAFNVPTNLKDDYQFIQGQYLTLKTRIDGEEVRRSYSICVSPLDNELRVAVKKVPGGVFSTYANEVLREGEELDVMTPTGRFYTEVKADQKKNYVAFAAGSGITPVMAIMKTVLETEPESEFTLFYGNKHSGKIIFKEQIEDLKDTYTERLSVYHILSKEETGSDLFYGRIDEEKCGVFCSKLFDPLKIDEYFLCGPEPMIRLVSKKLEDSGVDKSKVHFELFTSPTQLEGATKAAANEEAEKDVDHASITLQIDGDKTTYELEDKSVTILDSALDNGLDVPFACKGAVCMTCRAKLISGEARMDMNYALTDDEVKQGYILTCQAHPTTKAVEVSFDD